MQPLNKSYLGEWEHRNIKIQLYEENGLPYAIAGEKRIPAERIYFGLRPQIGAELVAIIKEIGRQIAAGELESERQCSAVLIDERLYFFLPLLGAGQDCSKPKQVTPQPAHSGGFIQAKDNLAFWNLSKSTTLPSTLFGCGTTQEIALLWKKADVEGKEELKKQCEELALKVIGEYQKIVPKQKDHVIEVLPLATIGSADVSFALLQSFNTDLASSGTLDNPVVTMGLAYFIHLAPKSFLNQQANGNLKRVLLQLNERVRSLAPSKMAKKDTPLQDPRDLLAAVEALSEILDAIADSNVPVLLIEDKNLIHSVIDTLEEHPDFRVRNKVAYAKQALLRVPGQEPQEYLLLCQAGRTLSLIDQFAHGVATLSFDQIAGMFNTFQQIRSNLDELKALNEKGQGWYSDFRKCEYFLLLNNFQDYEKLVQKIPPNPENSFFPSCLLLLFRKLIQTHPSDELRKNCVKYIGYLLNPKWGSHPEFMMEIVYTLRAIEKSGEPALSREAQTILARFRQPGGQPVQPMTFLPPSSQFPAKLLEKAKQLSSVSYLSLMKTSALQEFERRNFLPEFKKLLPLTLDTGEILKDKMLGFIDDKNHDFMVVNGSHGCGKTLYSLFLEWFLWENFNQYETIPLYISFEEKKHVEVLEEALQRIFIKKGCEKFLEEAKKRKVLLIVDHFEAMPLESQLSEDCDLAQWPNIKVLVMNGSHELPNLEAIVFRTAECVPLIDRCFTVNIQDLNREAIQKFAELNIDPAQQQRFMTFCDRAEMKPLTTVYLHLNLLSKVFGKIETGDLYHLFQTFVGNWLDTQKKLRRRFSQPLDMGFYRFMETATWFSHMGEKEKLRAHLSNPDHKKSFWGPLVFEREFPLCSLGPGSITYTHQLFQYYFLATLFVSAVAAHVNNEEDPFLKEFWDQLSHFPFDHAKEFLINMIQVDKDFQESVTKICLKNGISPKLLPLFRLITHIPKNARSVELDVLKPPPSIICDQIRAHPMVLENPTPKRVSPLLPSQLRLSNHDVPDHMNLVTQSMVERNEVPGASCLFKRGSEISLLKTGMGGVNYIDMSHYQADVVDESLLLNENIILKHPYEGELYVSPYALLPCPATIKCFAFSRCGGYLAFGGADKTIHIYSVSRIKEIGSIKKVNNGVESIAFSPDLTKIAWGAKDLNITTIDTNETLLLERNASPTALLFTPDLLFAGNRSGEIKLWKQETYLSKVQGPSPVLSFACNEKNTLLASAHSGGEVCLWNINNTNLILMKEFKEADPLLTLVFYKDQNLFVKTAKEIINYHHPSHSVVDRYNHTTSFLGSGKRYDHAFLGAKILGNRLALWKIEFTGKTNPEILSATV